MRTLALALLVLAAGCQNRSKCAPGGKPALAVRDATGALTLELRGEDLCDARDARLGSISTKADGVVLKDPRGAVRLEITRESATVAQGRDAAGPKLRLYRDDKELRVLKPDGVPLGSAVPEAGVATIYNQASAPLGRASMRGPDGIVADMTGSVQTYIVPAVGPGPAAVFGIPGLETPERIAIYMYWSR